MRMCEVLGQIKELYRRAQYLRKESKLEKYKEEKLSVEVRRQEKIDRVEYKDSRRRELLGKYIVKILYEYVRRSSHWGGSLQNELRDEWTCGMTLASAYVLCHLSTLQSQLQMIGRSLRQE